MTITFYKQVQQLLLNMLLAIIIAVIAVYSLYWWLNSRPKNYPPGFPILPIVGSVPFLPREHLHLKIAKMHEKYGPVVGGMIRNRPIIFVYGTEAVKEVLRRDEFQERPDVDFIRERSFNKRLGVFFSAGEYWQEQRRFILRHLRDLGFGKSSMESIALDEAQETIDYLKHHNVVSISGLFNLPVINVLWLITGGTRFTRDDKNTQQIMDKIFRWFRISNVVGNIANVFPIVKLLAPGISGHKERYQITLDLQMMFRDVIREHVKTRDPQNPRDFIDVYLNEIEKQNSNEDTGYTEESLIVILMDLFAAGAESISNTISFFLMYMVLYPNVQKAVHEELDRVIGRNRKPSLNDRSSLPYVDAALAESMRCNSIAPLTPPHRTTKETQLMGYTIPKSTTVNVNLWSVLYDRKHWKDPENFRPERFISPDGKFIKDENLILFGLGKRSCLGERLAVNTLFTFITCLMQAFSFSLPPGEPKPSTLALSGLTAAPQPFRLQITPRD